MDYNFVHIPGMKKTEPAFGLAEQSGNDAHSLKGDALFVAPGKGNYSVEKESPVLEIGFKNFPMDNFGVRSPRLKALAKTPDLPVAAENKEGEPDNASEIIHVREAGAKVRLAMGSGDLSVHGLKQEDLGKVAIVVSVEKGGIFHSAGIAADDVILSINGKALNGIGTLRGVLASGGKFDFNIRRNQENRKLEVQAK